MFISIIVNGSYVDISVAQGPTVTFEIGEDTNPQPPAGPEEDDRGWECVWSCHTATPVFHMSFSPDGTLFATAGKSDRLVKIWFENKQCKYFHSLYRSPNIVRVIKSRRLRWAGHVARM